MFNDLTSLRSYLATRRSGRPREMVGPGPAEAEIEAMIGLALRTPDHGKLAPWRFVIVGDDQRDALADLLLRALSENDPGATEAHRAKARDFAHNGAALVVMLSAPVANHKIPVFEQEMSAGAAAMNLLHAIHSFGYVGSWITGWAAFDPTVRAAFAQAPDERVVGFFFIGKPGRELEERPRPDPRAVIRHWQP
jgi:nitroreductase